MDKVLTALKSRTAWTVVALVLINGVPTAAEFIPAAWLPIVNGVLGILAVYFRVNPRV